MAPLPVDDEALALDEIKAVGPGGNHLARPYTRKHFRQIWQSDLFDTTRHDAWEAGGSQTLLDRLQARVAELRSEPRAFELPDDVEGRPRRDPRGRRGPPSGDLTRGKNRCTCAHSARRFPARGAGDRLRPVPDASSISISTINRACGL